MITKLTLRSFKGIADQTYQLKRFDLLVGPNNCGKSTILQALAIWQFCVDEFRRAKRSGASGVQVVLPNFTALPVPEFDLLWKDRTDRRYTLEDNRRKQEYILIEIGVEWPTDKGEKKSFEVKLRYNSPQSVYAIPSQSWEEFRKLEEERCLPVIAYVPPFSGLEPHEEWRDDAPIRAQVGKAQPGSVLRNLLLKVCPSPPRDDQGRKDYVPPRDWVEIKSIVRRWFSVELQEPQYERGVDKYIECLYRESETGTRRKKKGKKDLFDIIAGGSGFHQTLTLLAFLYGYRPTTILLDEPDAHLHVKLQREILEYFKQRSNERGTQFLIATHAEELVTGVDVSQIISLLARGRPKRVESETEILRAMADLSNVDIAAILALPLPFLLYVEGDTDERVLHAWAKECGAESIFSKLCFHAMGGGPKKEMKENADKHFEAMRQVVPNVKRLALFDYDTQETAFRPEPDNPVLFEWNRKNIENYLLVPEAWIRAAFQASDLDASLDANSVFAPAIKRVIDGFFVGENLTLPPGQSWRNVSANIFRLVDGKSILYESEKSLFQQLRQLHPSIELIRETVAGSMTAEEIHEDVHTFFAKLKKAVST
ncbi:MAG: AAA family ATPase [Candidatus Coatesbacteria bacterium]|nr:AAA family ATPase [Candidatus Coatesbacteria bacterium]